VLFHSTILIREQFEYYIQCLFCLSRVAPGFEPLISGSVVECSTSVLQSLAYYIQYFTKAINIFFSLYKAWAFSNIWSRSTHVVFLQKHSYIFHSFRYFQSTIFWKLFSKQIQIIIILKQLLLRNKRKF